MADGGIFGMDTASKIVNPEILLNSLDRKFKAFLSSFQVAVFSRAEALNQYNMDPEVNVLKAFIIESIDLSGSVKGKMVEGYIKVANTRVSVDDRKRSVQMNQGGGGETV